MQSLSLVFQYRTLVGKCEAGVGLDFDEIDALTAIEAAFAPGPDDTRGDGRRFRRLAVDFTGMLRGGDLNDRVHIAELAPGGLVVRQAPYIDPGMQVEIVIDDRGGGLSYRFKARVQWLREDIGDDFALGLELIGMPVLVHYGQGERPSVVDKLDQLAA